MIEGGEGGKEEGGKEIYKRGSEGRNDVEAGG